MLVYHGSYIEITKPDISFGRDKLDLGKGFYVTTLREQAEKWGSRKAAQENMKPIVNVYDFCADDLNILHFDGYTEQWLDFVVKNRKGEKTKQLYDAIYGNIANDDVATIVNDYMRLLRMRRIDSEAKRFYLGQIQYSKPNNQYCIASEKGISALRFIESCELG